ncbi:MAG: hypothetical protein AAB296_08130, partial [Candidatus Desantisbacteria bacterium]
DKARNARYGVAGWTPHIPPLPSLWERVRERECDFRFAIHDLQASLPFTDRLLALYDNIQINEKGGIKLWKD